MFKKRLWNILEGKAIRNFPINQNDKMAISCSFFLHSTPPYYPLLSWSVSFSTFFFFFFNLLIYLFISGCVGSSLLYAGFL